MKAYNVPFCVLQKLALNGFTNVWDKEQSHYASLDIYERKNETREQNV